MDAQPDYFAAMRHMSVTGSFSDCITNTNLFSSPDEARISVQASSGKAIALAFFGAGLENLSQGNCCLPLFHVSSQGALHCDSSSWQGVQVIKIGKLL
jgi:hypothetical protein